MGALALLPCGWYQPCAEAQQAGRQTGRGRGSTAAAVVDHAGRASYSTVASSFLIAGGCSMYQLKAESRRRIALNEMILQFLRLQD
jgi:hypothetical protein